MVNICIEFIKICFDVVHVQLKLLNSKCGRGLKAYTTVRFRYKKAWKATPLRGPDPTTFRLPSIAKGQAL